MDTKRKFSNINSFKSASPPSRCQWCQVQALHCNTICYLGLFNLLNYLIDQSYLKYLTVYLSFIKKGPSHQLYCTTHILLLERCYSLALLVIMGTLKVNISVTLHWITGRMLPQCLYFIKLNLRLFIVKCCWFIRRYKRESRVTSIWIISGYIIMYINVSLWSFSINGSCIPLYAFV